MSVNLNVSHTTAAPPASLSWPDAAAVAALLVPGVLAFGPVFGGAPGWIAAGGGALLGVVIALLARRLRWSSAVVMGATLGAYLVFGGPLALPRTTIAGIVPTLETLQRLIPLTIQAWRDLLTVSLPASNFTGPAVVPLIAALAASVTGMLLGQSRRPLLGVLPPAALLVVGILWGAREAPLAGILGAAFALVALVWLARHATSPAGDEGTAILGERAASASRRRLGAAAALIVGAVAVGVAAQPLVASDAHRLVLRDVVTPPLNLQDYPSPLTSFRSFEVDQKDVTLFTVTGLPEGARLRLATMDAYDGNVYSLAGPSAGFVRIGETMGGTPSGPEATLDVTATNYSGVWVAGAGELRGIRFQGQAADAQLQGLHHSTFSQTTLTTAGVAPGDRWTQQVVIPAQPDDAAARTVADRAVGAVDQVPDVVAALAQEYAGEAGTPLEQLRNLERSLTSGYYANGADGKSRAGHTSERITAMLTAPALIGDDEQYAVAMALMARQLGIPARVVLGFYPGGQAPATGPLELRGTDAHVWVEVPFNDVGWVVFDPTPDRNRVPQTEVPQPKPNPKPQVLPPPDPPLDPFEQPLDNIVSQKRDSSAPLGALLLQILSVVATVLGSLLLLAAPFLAVLAVKRRRSARRRAEARAADRVSGAWDEVADAAVDLGTPLAATLTRREAARTIDAAHPDAGAVRLAEWVDTGVFGPHDVSDPDAQHLWDAGAAAIATMRGSVGRWRRLAASVSLRSLGLSPGGLLARGRDLAARQARRLTRKDLP